MQEKTVPTGTDEPVVIPIPALTEQLLPFLKDAYPLTDIAKLVLAGKQDEAVKLSVIQEFIEELTTLYAEQQAAPTT